MTFLWPILLSGILATVGPTPGGDGVLPMPTPSGSVMSGVASDENSIEAVSVADSWLPYFLGVWYLDEGTTSTRTNSGTCGSSCNLSRSGNTTNDTTDFMQGTASNIFDGTGDYLSCSDGTCTSLDLDSSISFGCWGLIRTGAGAHDGAPIAKHDGTLGYELEFDYGLETVVTGKFKCRINANTVSQTHLVFTAFQSFLHYGCVFDDKANTLQIFMSGTGLASTAVSEKLYQTTTDFKLGSSSNIGDIDGNVDECFVYSGVLTAKDFCRICSCGMDGSLCTCGGSEWGSTGRNDTYCGDCVLPAECHGAPGAD